MQLWPHVTPMSNRYTKAPLPSFQFKQSKVMWLESQKHAACFYKTKWLLIQQLDAISMAVTLEVLSIYCLWQVDLWLLVEPTAGRKKPWLLSHRLRLTMSSEMAGSTLWLLCIIVYASDCFCYSKYTESTPLDFCCLCSISLGVSTLVLFSF